MLSLLGSANAKVAKVRCFVERSERSFWFIQSNHTSSRIIMIFNVLKSLEHPERRTKYPVLYQISIQGEVEGEKIWLLSK